MKKAVIVFLMSLSTYAFAQSKTLSLEEYLGLVESGNKSIRGSKEKSEGAALRSQEGYLITSPYLFMNASQTSDQSEKPIPLYQGTKTEATVYSLGLSKVTEFGLSGKLGYNLTKTSITGANTQFVPESKYYEAKPTLELSQSFWRNGFGSETTAQVEAAEAAGKAEQYKESFAVKVARSEAEMAYWKLSLARAMRIVQSDSLDRSRKIREWNLKRFQNQLADKSDFLQADAAFKLREYEYQQAADEERSASRKFNTLRGVDSDVVTELVAPLPQTPVKPIQRAKNRDDVLASEQAMRAAKAQSQLGIEKARPTLDAFANLSYNGKDGAQGEAVNESTKSTYQSSTIGVKFTMPLDFWTVSDVKDGYKKEELAADFKHQHKLFEQEQEWTDLNRKLSEAQKRLSLASGYEEAQKSKYEFERLRHAKGRSTTFYVLQFEQEYALAQVNRLRAQVEVLGLVAQLKTFGGAQ